jgi:hypothetical protein
MNLINLTGFGIGLIGLRVWILEIESLTTAFQNKYAGLKAFKTENKQTKTLYKRNLLMKYPLHSVLSTGC